MAPGASPVETSREPGLSARLAPLLTASIALWHSTPAVVPPLGPVLPKHRQWRNGRDTRRLIDEVARRIETYPDDDADRRAWRDELRTVLQAFGEARFGWPAGYRRLLFGDAFFDASVSFARCARALDPSISLDDLWQAMRNVWIGNSLQMLIGRAVTLPPPLFAYSMLYPATDNVLDERSLPAAAKHTFNIRLGRRLAGVRLDPQMAGEATVFALVAQIEDAFPRGANPDVWDSVLAIYHAQVGSLRQQENPPPSEAETMNLSFAKGGASVLADLHLIAGRVTPAREQFAFRYGVFLQLLDDLQDVTIDQANGHHTLFTHAAERGPLDVPTARLAQFIDVVLGSQCVDAPELADCRDLIRRNCLSLLVGVVADQPGRFTRSFRQSIERQSPIGFRAMRRLRQRARRRFDITAHRLRDRYGIASPLDLLLT